VQPSFGCPAVWPSYRRVLEFPEPSAVLAAGEVMFRPAAELAAMFADFLGWHLLFPLF